MAPRSRNASGYGPLTVTFRRDDAAAWAVIGPLATDPTQNRKGSRLCHSACVVVALRECGTIISP